MALLPAALLALCLGALWWVTRKDVADYAAFKLLTRTEDRQRRYRKWVLTSFLIFFCAPVACLAVLGRLDAIVTAPVQFGALAAFAHAAGPSSTQLGDGFLGGLFGALIGVSGFALLAGVLAARRKGAAAKPAMLGDVEPLMPRNWAETAHTALLSLNAGISEELFFRLLLPLLIALSTGSAAAGFIVAALIFGLAHIYQGWVGVAATTVVGVVFTAVYLWTGNLFIAMALHVALDLIGLVIRPTVMRLARQR